jgi:hypothetical protein
VVVALDDGLFLAVRNDDSGMGRRRVHRVGLLDSSEARKEKMKNVMQEIALQAARTHPLSKDSILERIKMTPEEKKILYGQEHGESRAGWRSSVQERTFQEISSRKGKEYDV